MARQAGCWGVSRPPPRQPPGMATWPPAAPDPAHPASLPAGEASTASSTQSRNPPAPGTRVFSAEEARKWPRPNSPRPPEKPTTPPASLSPAAPGRPPQSSAQAPARFGDVGASGSEWGCARQAGRPPRCHPSGPYPGTPCLALRS